MGTILGLGDFLIVFGLGVALVGLLIASWRFLPHPEYGIGVDVKLAWGPVAITPSPFSVFVDNQPEVGLSHAPRWVLAISYDAVLVADDKERRLVWVPMKYCRLKLADS